MIIKNMRKVVVVGAMCLAAATAVMGTDMRVSAAQTSENVYEVTATPGCTAKDIQELLDLNENGQYGKLIINFPAGEYKLDRPIFVYSNTTLKSTPQTHFLKQKANGAILEGKLVNDQGGFNTVSNITIDGGIWDSSPIFNHTDGSESFRFIHASNVTVQNAEFKNVPAGSHFIVFAGAANSTVTNCTFHGYGTNTHNDKGEIKPKEAIQFDITHDNVILPTEQAVKWDDLGCKNITISNCTFSDFPRAIGSHTAVKGVFHDGIVITNNTITGMTETSLKLYNYMNTVVSNNVISGGVEGILVYTQVEGAKDDDLKNPLNGIVAPSPTNYNIVIKDNVISDVKTLGNLWGDAIRVSGSVSMPLPGVTVTGNHISNVKRYGIFATEAALSNISGNVITGSAKHGILLEENCTNSIVNGNSVTNPGESGIAVYTGSDNTVVSGNAVQAPKDCGIYLFQVNGCAVGVDAANFNTITNPKVSGIYITQNCSGNSVNYNQIKNAGKDGIWVYKSTKNTIASNTISAKGDGIDINTNSKATVVKNNVIQSAGDCGIWLSSKSTGSTISGNKINKYSVTAKNKNAIGVFQSGGNSSKNRTMITKNVIKGTGKKTTKDAIRVSGSNYVDVTSNTITSADGYGVYIYQSKNNTISSNKITKSKKGGIYVTTACNKAKIQKNTVKNPGDTAIMTYKAPSSVVSGNIVTVSKSKKGIWISTSNKTTVKGNKVSGATKKNAVRVTSSTGCKVSGNTIK